MKTLDAIDLNNVLAVYDGPRWLAGYGVLLAMGALATAFAIVATIAMFRGLGPKRTRFISQIVSAVVGAGFVIGAQGAAILSTGKFSRLEIFKSQDVIAAAPGPACPVAERVPVTAGGPRPRP